MRAASDYFGTTWDVLLDPLSVTDELKLYRKAGYWHLDWEKDRDAAKLFSDALLAYERINSDSGDEDRERKAKIAGEIARVIKEILSR